MMQSGVVRFKKNNGCPNDFDEDEMLNLVKLPKTGVNHDHIRTYKEMAMKRMNILWCRA